jgi:hypothetical protein
MAQWLAPIPWRLFATVAAQDSLGPGGYEVVTKRMLQRLSDMSDTPTWDLGALQFTAPHRSGELHAHIAIAGPESLLGCNRAEVARYLEADLQDLHKLSLSHDQDPNRWRVDLQASKGYESVVGYCALQYGYSQAGDLREVGLRLPALFERYAVMGIQGPP